jgi:hypothetical protein
MEKKIIRRRPQQPLVLIPMEDGEYDDEADVREMNDKIQEFLFGISKGYSVQHSCALSGCKEETMHRWLDKRSINFKPKLNILYRRAQAVFYAKQIDKIAEAKDWKAAAMWLERHEADWNPKDTSISISAHTGEVPMIRMDSETINELSKAYDERFKVKKAK